ncbi:uncharacterized protein LOC131932306 [Physella acuta]|uniref:uncharacterized protein LOC131932306 n=1 Tax=Physella acuta TaxID=109671 RepID=UPI0027DCFCF0|nr:uncharacterized protein LOC131932306 [Physella acuta]
MSTISAKIVVWILLAAVLVPTAHACKTTIRPLTLEMKENFLYGINDERRSKRRKPVVWNDALAELAQQILAHTCTPVTGHKLTEGAYLAYCRYPGGFKPEAVADLCSYKMATDEMMYITSKARLVGCAMTICKGVFDSDDQSLCLLAPKIDMSES